MIKYWFNILLLTCLSLSLKANFYEVKDAPRWVIKNEIPKESQTSKYEINSGYYYSLADYQVLLDEEHYYTREVTNVISYSGITNASQLAITFDTSYQKLVVHHLHIWRGGKVIDRTDELDFEIMNNENNLDKGIYSGLISAYQNLEDIRKDDMIDFAFSLIGQNPIFKNEKYLFTALEATNPIDDYTVRILYDKTKNYETKCSDCDSTIIIEESVVDDYKEINLRRTNLKAISLEDNIPTWQTPYKYFMLSSYKSWVRVNKWAEEVFKCPEEQNLKDVFDEIFTGDESLEEKIDKIINYTQDDIRYMGIESGIGSIKPFLPEQVVKQRFGDCKDKSLLMVTLLKQIGIKEAYPVLVNTLMKDELNSTYFPSNQVFNHCIVNFTHEGKSFWIDPTITQQGSSFKNMYTPDYGDVLVVGLPGDSLANMPPNSAESFTHVVETYDINSFTEPATLNIKSIRNGYESDSRRAFLEYYSISDVSKQITEDLELQFPEVKQLNDPIITDNLDSNIFTTTYNYSISGFWQDGDNNDNNLYNGYWFYRFEPQSIYSYISSSTCREREYDYQLAFPLKFKYTVYLNFHKELFISDGYRSTENSAFSFTEKIIQTSSQSLKIEYDFEILQPFIQASKYKDICEDINLASKDLPLYIYFPK